MDFLSLVGANTISVVLPAKAVQKIPLLHFDNSYLIPQCETISQLCERHCSVEANHLTQSVCWMIAVVTRSGCLGLLSWILEKKRR
jgi:hypothetical protein